MSIEFVKMQGAGNRILVVDARGSGASVPTPVQCMRLGDERTGPGFDQLMWVTGTRAGGIAAYRVFNADGSEAGQCGNGVRCVARLLSEDCAAGTFVLDGPAGPVECRVGGDGRVAVNLGAPVFEPAAIPFLADRAANAYRIDANGVEHVIGAVSMGNPHCVLEVADVGRADVAGIGARLEGHPRFPDRANVGFMAVKSRTAIDLRVFERGVGETPACGTGACAAFAVAHRRGQLDDEVTVTLPGGQLVISCAQRGSEIWLSGHAEILSEGKIEL